MKHIFVVVLSVLFCYSAALAQDTDANLKSTIQGFNDKMEQAMLNNDFNSISDMYADDVVSLPSYSQIVKGKDQVRQNIQKEMEAGNKFSEVEFTTTDVRREGNILIEVGTYNITMTMKDAQEPMSDNGKYLTVWEREGADWKIAYEIWNSDNNPWENMQKDKMQSPDDQKE